MKFLLYLGLFSVLLYFILCIIVYINQEKLLFYPEPLSDTYRYTFTTPFQEINFHPDQHTTINALRFKHPNPKGIILYFHGNAGSLKSWGIEGEYLSQFKYDVLLIDYRGYGKSRGVLNEKNLLTDAQYIYDQIKKELPEENIIVFGRSLGTGMAAFIASQNKPGKLLLETPYYSMEELAALKFSWLPTRLLLKYPLYTHRYLKKVSCPICIFHGTVDQIIPYQSSLKLKKVLKEGDRYVSIKGGDHNNLSQFDEYTKALTLFLL